VFQRRFLQHENKAQTCERGHINDVSACGKKSSSQSELCAASHNLAHINTTIHDSQVSFTQHIRYFREK
jgi:hypothetical protein